MTQLERRVLARLGLKFCNGCGNAKPFKHFGADCSTRDGYAKRCQPCTRSRRQAIQDSYRQPCKCGGTRSMFSVGQCVKCYREEGERNRIAREEEARLREAKRERERGWANIVPMRIQLPARSKSAATKKLTGEHIRLKRTLNRILNEDKQTS